MADPTYVANTDGYSSTVNVYHISGTQNNNDGGTVKRGGSVVDTRFSSAVPVYQGERAVVGSVVVDNNWANKAVSAGTFAKMAKGQYVAMKISTKLAGVNNTILLSGALVPSEIRSINKLEVLRTRKFTSAIRANKYNRVTGAWEAGYPQVTVDSLATDNAATPSMSVPGRVVFKLGGKVPVSVNYKAKTN